jgi:hypothetical protein
VKVCVNLLRDRDAGVTKDLGQLEDVTAGREEQAGERVPQVVQTQLLRQTGADHCGLEWPEDAGLVARQLLVELVELRAGPEQGVLALRELHLA